MKPKYQWAGHMLTWGRLWAVTFTATTGDRASIFLTRYARTLTGDGQTAKRGPEWPCGIYVSVGRFGLCAAYWPSGRPGRRRADVDGVPDSGGETHTPLAPL